MKLIKVQDASPTNNITSLLPAGVYDLVLVFLGTDKFNGGVTLDNKLFGIGYLHDGSPKELVFEIDPGDIYLEPSTYGAIATFIRAEGYSPKFKLYHFAFIESGTFKVNMLYRPLKFNPGYDLTTLLSRENHHTLGSRQPHGIN